MKRKRGKVIQVEHGDTLARKALEAHICCDCGLAHLYRLSRRKGKLVETIWRDNRRTANARRGKEYRGLKLPFRLRKS